MSSKNRTDDLSESQPLTLTLPDALVERIAHRVAQLMREDAEKAEKSLTFDQACAYLGFTADKLYKLTAARAIPTRKKSGGQALVFQRDELDCWMESAYPRLD